MTMVVGIAPDGRDRAVLQPAGMLARSAGDDLVLCATVPVSWPPSPAKVDAEDRAHLERTANEALNEARARLPAEIPATLVVHHGRSAAVGLVEVTEQRDAGLIVVGPPLPGPSGAWPWAVSLTDWCTAPPSRSPSRRAGTAARPPPG